MTPSTRMRRQAAAPPGRRPSRRSPCSRAVASLRRAPDCTAPCSGWSANGRSSGAAQAPRNGSGDPCSNSSPAGIAGARRIQRRTAHGLNDDTSTRAARPRARDDRRDGVHQRGDRRQCRRLGSFNSTLTSMSGPHASNASSSVGIAVPAAASPRAAPRHGVSATRSGRCASRARSSSWNTTTSPVRTSSRPARRRRRRRRGRARMRHGVLGLERARPPVSDDQREPRPGCGGATREKRTIPATTN